MAIPYISTAAAAQQPGEVSQKTRRTLGRLDDKQRQAWDHIYEPVREALTRAMNENEDLVFEGKLFTNGLPELYHLNIDPGEKYNRAEEFPDLVEELLGMMRVFNESVYEW